MPTLKVHTAIKNTVCINYNVDLKRRKQLPKQLILNYNIETTIIEHQRVNKGIYFEQDYK